VRLIFDGPGWGSCRGTTWILEEINGKQKMTHIAYGEIVEAHDLEDGSLRSEHLKRQLKNETCRMLDDAPRGAPKRRTTAE